MLEAVASYDLWIWHAFFGASGLNNDINVLDQSPLFTEQLQGKAPEVQFTVNGSQYNMGYYLADGIYPEWATFVKTINRPLSPKHKLFASYQEGEKKSYGTSFQGVAKALGYHTSPSKTLGTGRTRQYYVCMCYIAQHDNRG